MQTYHDHNASSWVRVNKSHPCRICGKPDWCLIASDGSAAICQRIESEKRCGDAGCLHRLRDEKPFFQPRPQKSETIRSGVAIDFGLVMKKFQNAIDSQTLQALEKRLGVAKESLQRLGVGWDKEHWASTFPMFDHRSKVKGIRIRKNSGKKFCVNGSKQGLFLPNDLPSDLSRDVLLICEGPTDTAAALDLNFLAIGRPNCSAAVLMTSWLIRDRRPKQVIIVADHDEPGQLGAEKLASLICMYCRDVRVVTPPAKDLREWKRSGASAADIHRLVQSVSSWKTKIARII